MRGHLSKKFPAEIVPGPRHIAGKGLSAMNPLRLTSHEIDQVVDFMREASGNDLSEKGALITSKLGLLCERLGYAHFYELWDAAQGVTIAAAQLRQQIIDELTTSYSYFNREHAHFALISDLIAAGKLPVAGSALRVWSAGCASGEETYNLAMVCEDARHGGLLSGQYHIVGSDISSHAIEDAKKGSYDAADVARMPPHWRNLYCMRSGSAYEVKGALRNHVEYRCENVLAPRPDSPFDLVVCRNMLIYFDTASSQRFCALVRGRVKAGGYLVLGHAEIFSDMPGFSYVEPSLWQRNGDDAADFLSLLPR